MKPTFQDRLQRVLREGNLTVMDLSRWLGRPYQTVNNWAKGGRMGRELPPLDAAYVTAQLAILERRLSKKQGLPVPRMSQRDRKAYIEGLIKAKVA